MKEIQKSIEQSSVENNKYTLDLVNSWINNADVKISISCALSSLVIALVALGAENILSKIAENCEFNNSLLAIFKVVVFFDIAIFLVSLWFHFWALNPSLISAKAPIRKPQYSIFFEEISRFGNMDDYKKSALKATEARFNEEVLQEIYINSGICTKKMKRFRIGMWCSVVTIIGTILACILFYFAIM